MPYIEIIQSIAIRDCAEINEYTFKRLVNDSILAFINNVQQQNVRGTLIYAIIENNFDVNIENNRNTRQIGKDVIEFIRDNNL